MKKVIIGFFLGGLLFSLVSCGMAGQDRTSLETHTWGEFRYDAEEHIRECLDIGCGAIDKEKHFTRQLICEEVQFCDVCHHEYGDMIPHEWKEGFCAVCMENQHGADLEYFHADDFYIVSGIGKCAYSDIEISSTHKYLPVTEIAEHAFAKVSHVESIVVPDSVQKIGWGAFSGCDHLKTVSLPSDLTSIEGYLFHNCKMLERVKIPDGVTHIGDHAFYHCESLVSVELPSALAVLDGTPFAGCSSLQTIMFDGTVAQFEAVKKAGASIPKGLTVSCTDGEWQHG